MYRAAARQVEAAKLAVDAARAKRAPTFKVALTSGWEGVDPPRTFDHYYGASYDGAVSVPIFDGGLIRSHIDQAQRACTWRSPSSIKLNYKIKEIWGMRDRAIMARRNK